MEQQAGRIPSSVQEIPGHDDTFQAARERLSEAAHYADQRVRNNPWTSVGIGFGVGVAIGALITLAAASMRR